MNCPVCHQPYRTSEHRGPHKGFKGASYSEDYYQHETKECVFQKSFYPNYFGKGPKTVVHTWEHNLQYLNPHKGQISFVTENGITTINKVIPKPLFIELLKAKAVAHTDRGWEFNPDLCKKILEKEYEII